MQLTNVDLRFSHDGRAAHLTIPGGELTDVTGRELAWAAESLIELRDLVVVCLSASGADFCTGPADDLAVHELRPDPASALARLRPPVIATVDGACSAEGLEVLLATDIRLATARSTFAMDHVTRGRVPTWGGTQRLPRCIGSAAATAMLLIGEPISAARALELGLLHATGGAQDNVTADGGRSADGGIDGTVADERDRLVEVLLSRGPLSLELAKEAVHRGSELPLRDGLRLEGDLNHQLAVTEDRAEGLAAFFEKRPPDFSGR